MEEDKEALAKAYSRSRRTRTTTRSGRWWRSGREALAKAYTRGRRTRKTTRSGRWRRSERSMPRDKVGQTTVSWRK